MATVCNSGGQSPTSISRNEKALKDAQYTGIVNLSGRKLKEFPSSIRKYDLADTTTADLSKNRFTEVPSDVCEFQSLEKLSCYSNIIKSIPEALVQLQALVQLNLSRNQLSNIPPFICNLQCLELLQASNNRLVSLPEEIGKLDRLMELDVSCNEITHLPSQIGHLECLKSLNVRRNLLVELPVDISRLRLHRLDISSNKISHLPYEMRSMDTLQEILLEHNPLNCPPARICTKGRVHILKYLQLEAIKENRKRGILENVELRKNYRKSAASLQSAASEDFRYADSPVDRTKRHTVDSGYSTADSNQYDNKARWSPSEYSDYNPRLPANRWSIMSLERHTLSVNGDIEESNNLALKAAESVKEQRQEREMRRTPRPQTQPTTPTPLPPETGVSMPKKSPGSNASFDPNTGPPGNSPGESPSPSDAFTRELLRQKAEYEAKKRRAEQVRMEREREDKDRDRDDELQERRRAALRLQEEQRALLERHRGESKKKKVPTATLR